MKGGPKPECHIEVILLMWKVTLASAHQERGKASLSSTKLCRGAPSPNLVSTASDGHYHIRWINCGVPAVHWARNECKRSDSLRVWLHPQIFQLGRSWTWKATNCFVATSFLLELTSARNFYKAELKQRCLTYFMPWATCRNVWAAFQNNVYACTN
jgi:hypothetical protein